MLFWEGSTFIEIDKKSAKQRCNWGYGVFYSVRGSNNMMSLVTNQAVQDVYDKYKNVQFFKLHDWGTYQ